MLVGPQRSEDRRRSGRLSTQAHTPAGQRVLALLKAESRQPAPAGLRLHEGKAATLRAPRRQPTLMMAG